MGRNTRWLIIIPAILFALFAKPAKAEVLGEWTYSQSCPTSGSVEVIEDTIILHGPNDNGCAGQPHWVKIETTIPSNVDTIDFTWAYQTYDGAWYDPPQFGVNGVYTQLTNQSNATGTRSIPVQQGDVFTFRQYSVDTCCQPGHLTISNLSLWVSITTSTTSTTTTTTTVQETTVPATVPTTTTVPETTSLPQTTLPVSVPTTTLLPETSTSTIPPTTVQTTVPMPVTVPPTVAPVPLTTTTVPETTTISTTSTTVLETTTSTTVKPQVKITTTTSAPVKTTDPVPYPSVSLPQQTLLLPPLLPPSSTSSTPPLPVEETLQAISTKSNDEVAALATSPEVLATVSTEQAAQIFEALDVEELSDAQVEQLVAAVQNAPDEVRQEFEDKVDIFKSGLDTYVPVGSTVPIGTRRTLIAVTAGMTLVAAGVRIKR